MYTKKEYTLEIVNKFARFLVCSNWCIIEIVHSIGKNQEIQNEIIFLCKIFLLNYLEIGIWALFLERSIEVLGSSNIQENLLLSIFHLKVKYKKSSLDMHNFVVFEYIIRKKCRIFGITNLPFSYKRWFTSISKKSLKNFNPSFKEINEKFNFINSLSFRSEESSFKDLNAEVADVICLGRTKKKKIAFITDRDNFVEEPSKKVFPKFLPIPDRESISKKSHFESFGKIKSTSNINVKPNPILSNSKVHHAKKISTTTNITHNPNIPKIPGAHRTQISFNL